LKFGECEAGGIGVGKLMLAVGLVDLGGEGGLVFVEGDDRWEGLAEEEIDFFQRNFESQKL
jgi:hypothetical protein